MYIDVYFINKTCMASYEEERTIQERNRETADLPSFQTIL